MFDDGNTDGADSFNNVINNDDDADSFDGSNNNGANSFNGVLVVTLLISFRSFDNIDSFGSGNNDESGTGANDNDGDNANSFDDNGANSFDSANDSNNGLIVSVLNTVYFPLILFLLLSFEDNDSL